MEWLKKKKDEAKQAAAKLQNKRTAFKGDGNVLGGDEAAAAASATSAASSSNSNGASKGFKVPFVKTAPPPISDEEKERRREMQTKAAEARTSAWDKRVTTARKARLVKEGEEESKFDSLPPVPPRSSSSSPTNAQPTNNVSVLSNEEVKRREMESARAQLGFNPYAATFASSTEVGAATNSIGNSSAATEMGPPPAPARVMPSSVPLPPASIPPSATATENGAVFVLLRQDPPRAIVAAETIIKMLKNILANPQEEKFRRVRLTNATIQTKLVQVPGAIDLLQEAGFLEMPIDGESFLVLTTDQFHTERVVSAVDRTEVALMQLQVDSIGL